MLIEKLELPTRTTNVLKKNHIYTSEDLALFLPRAYRDYRKTVYLQDAPVGEYCAVSCILDKCESCYGKRSYLKFKIHSPNMPGKYCNIFLFNEVYKYKEYRTYINKEIIICGKITNNEQYGKNMGEIESVCLAETFKGKIYPVYKKMSGVSNEMMKKLIADAVSIQPDILEYSVRKEFGIPSYRETLEKLHYPESMKDIETGRKRICLYNMIYFCLVLYGNQSAQTKSKFVFSKWKETSNFIKSLDYSLTDDQKKILNQIVLNAKNEKRNNILLQGDVGCGKTIVAICAMCCAKENGYQSVLMAPREVLAKQHYKEILEYKDKLNVNIAFLHSGMKAKERKKILENIKNGNIDLIVGTHSCISADVEYKKLGLIITDEEHLFGVKQKEALEKKAQKGVHCISMSATPIPRSLATVLYGCEKEICTINTMPKGRLPVKTCAVKGHKAVFKFIEEQAQKKYRTYVVCPAIDKNEEFKIVSIEEVEKLYRDALEKKGIRIGVIHGKMKSKDIEETVGKFSEGDLDVLISTTVVEVGVNIPEATLMIVEQADRFGLATLHQLRGRVGRSSIQSYCILITEKKNEPRILTMCETTNGFKIAEADMKIRGMGNLIGTEQSGMNQFVSEMLCHPKIFEYAKKTAMYCIRNNYGKYIINMYDEIPPHTRDFSRE